MSETEKSEWLVGIEEEIAKQEQLIKKKDYKFFQVDRLLRVAERVDHLSADCRDCKSLKAEIEEVSVNVAGFINGKPSQRRQLEKAFDKIMKHLKLNHEIYPVYYFMSLHSFIGVAIGTSLGVLVGLVIPAWMILSSFTGFSIGVIIGYISGNRKDLKARVEKRLV